MVENWIWQFATVFCQKAGQILFDLNFETRFQIILSFAAYIAAFCWNSQILIFGSPIVISKFQMPIFEFEIFMSDSESAPQKTKMGGGAIASPKKNGEHNLAYCYVQIALGPEIAPEGTLVKVLLWLVRVPSS